MSTTEKPKSLVAIVTAVDPGWRNFKAVTDALAEEDKELTRVCLVGHFRKESRELMKVLADTGFKCYYFPVSKNHGRIGGQFANVSACSWTTPSKAILGVNAVPSPQLRTLLRLVEGMNVKVTLLTN